MNNRYTLINKHKKRKKKKRWGQEAGRQANGFQNLIQKIHTQFVWCQLRLTAAVCVFRYTHNVASDETQMNLVLAYVSVDDASSFK